MRLHFAEPMSTLEREEVWVVWEEDWVREEDEEERQEGEEKVVPEEARERVNLVVEAGAKEVEETHLERIHTNYRLFLRLSYRRANVSHWCLHRYNDDRTHNCSLEAYRIN